MSINSAALKIKKYIKILFPGLIAAWRRMRRYSALNDLDKKLQKYLTKDKGFFIEIGANDGFSQSNTLWLEKDKGWEGLLIEAAPALYEQCRINRPKAKVFNCACVAEDYRGKTVKIIYADLMSIVAGHKTKQGEAHCLNSARRYCEEQFEFEASARTMTSILDECGVRNIDFLSLDVEGYELNVLRGLDLNKYHPDFILVEAENRELFDEYLKGRYIFVEKLSPHDYLYKHV